MYPHNTALSLPYGASPQIMDSIFHTYVHTDRQTDRQTDTDRQTIFSRLRL